MTAVQLSPELYRFDVGDETFEIPAFNHLKSGLIRQVRKMNEADSMYFVLESICDDRTLAALDGLDMVELRDIMQAWQTAAGVRLGE